MTTLAADVRRLLVECGLAAANHNLVQHAWDIYEALPTLLSAPGDRRLVEAAMLIGLGRDGQAARLLASTPGSEAALLRSLIAPSNAPLNATATSFHPNSQESIHGNNSRATRTPGTGNKAGIGRDPTRSYSD
ncbi:EscG/YscG/SsaH family type III secretion system needle protein co-chaperone [Burkholderia sp. Nafp2/4-1b]|uniref:EscG/YscG/SsaH family type III secretion system needle protein co-chaperone n=1 Tax=Burkholderia sp. Nafp2/4-1b TaxID=2116686 RepID=UPI000EF8F44E|nr:EscG/YscG/SsaH family type III secretion system needle protein co-chaperone [Burkholderia sp. Nafp2/4-1b]RKT98759.1 EscG/YscG/SsaH family type III secretion system needle protein co-chaperone [Burkholderia sp. Nafp2/4-1b]